MRSNGNCSSWHVVRGTAPAGLITVGQQLVINGGFENFGVNGAAPDSWPAPLVAYTGSPHSGAMRSQLIGGASSAQYDAFDGYAPDVTSLTVTGWMRSEDATAGIGEIVIESGPSMWNVPDSAFVKSDGTTAWKQYSMSVPISTGLPVRNTSGSLSPTSVEVPSILTTSQ